MDPALGPSRAYKSSVGQVAEWLVWTHLVASSGGDLHVFLPLKDQGIDGIVHRISTDEYARVQVKGRVPRLHALEVMVQANELADDLATVVAVETREGNAALGAIALVVSAPDFRRLAHRYETAGAGAVYQAAIPLPAPADSPWAPRLVPPREMGERLVPSRGERITSQLAVPPDWVAAGRLGLRAEMELLRRAADCGRLNAFKAFPDLEPNEYLIYDVATREIAGIQVKSVSFAAGANEAQVSVYRPALRPSAVTWFVILLEDEGETAFLPHCAVVPSKVVARYLAGNEAHGKLAITRLLTGRLARWRFPLTELGARLAELTSPHS
jgi:hypothetical protein